VAADPVGRAWATPLSVRALAVFQETGSWEAAGARLGIPPGRAYLVATGRPADAGQALNLAEREALGDHVGPTQQLVNPPHHNPTTTDAVHRWLRGRAGRELRPDRRADPHA
jgi:hypothetical protein